MKKIVSLFLSLTMIVSSACLYVSAEDEKVYSPAKISATESADELGIPSNLPPNALSDMAETEGDASLFYSIFDGGSGTAEDPYLVSTGAQLEYICQNVNGGSRTTSCFKLIGDIDLGGAEWTPIGVYTNEDKYSLTFQGVFDGNGHTISNFKITKATTRYIGFFGFIYNGTVKNLSLSDFDIDVNYSGYLYIGGIAGRCISQGSGKATVIENCHVSGNVYANSTTYSVYAGGITGYFMSDSYSTSEMKNCSSKCTIRATSQSSNGSISNYAGGLCGYVASNDNAGEAVTTISDCNASGNVYCTGSNGSTALTFAGGLSGFIGGSAKSISVARCFASGSVSSQSPVVAYAGGFSGYLVVTRGTATISDCYATGNVSLYESGIDLNDNYTCGGGLIGQTYSLVTGSYLENCYSIGNVIDTDSLMSYVGTTIGYKSDAKLVFTNCYGLQAAVVTGREKWTEGVNLLDEEQSHSSESYAGFDFENVWELTDESYAYPSLKSNGHVLKTCYISYISNGVLFDDDTCDSSMKITSTTLIPSKPSDVFNDYSFSHWSESTDGQAFDFENTNLYEDLTLYAVFNSVPHKYVISYMNGSTEYDAFEALYGESYTLPESLPTKPSDTNYKYKFLYWSLTENGAEFDLSGTVSSDVTLYAVFGAVGLDVWDGSTTERITSGNGTQDNPYKIRNVFQFAYLAEMVNSGDSQFSSAYYSLEADLDLGGYEWTPIGINGNFFTGSFVGNGYTISDYKVSDGIYAGLFGYVSGATLSGFTVKDFNIKYTATVSENVYAAPVAAYVSSDNGVATISHVTVLDGVIDVASSGNLYVGGLAGYVLAKPGKSYILNCYSIADVKAEATVKSAYAGGIAGYVYTGPSSEALIRTSYSLSSCTATGKISAYCGGIAGYIKSDGSDYSGWYTGDEEKGSLSGDDADILIGSCFATGDTSASGSNIRTSAGNLVGGNNDYATVIDSYYSSSQAAITTINGVIGASNTLGTSTSASNFRMTDFLRSKLSFDFDTVWTFEGNYVYPVLCISQAQKPTFGVSNVSFTQGELKADINVLSLTNGYYVSISAYDNMGRMIGFTRTKVTSDKQHENITLSIDNVSGAVKLKATVIDSVTLQPIFSAIERTLE